MYLRPVYMTIHDVLKTTNYWRQNKEKERLAHVSVQSGQPKESFAGATGPWPPHNVPHTDCRQRFKLRCILSYLSYTVHTIHGGLCDIRASLCTAKTNQTNA